MVLIMHIQVFTLLVINIEPTDPSLEAPVDRDNRVVESPEYALFTFIDHYPLFSLSL